MEIIKEYSQFIISSINKILDSSIHFQKNFNDYPSTLDDDKVKDYISGLSELSLKFEDLKAKLINEQYNLTPYEISLCGLVLAYAHEQFNIDKIALEKGMERISKIGIDLLGEDFESLISNFRKF